MVSVLDSGSSGPGSGPGQGHCVVFLSKTLPLYTHWRNAGGNPAIDLHPIQGGGGVEILLIASLDVKNLKNYASITLFI